MHYEEGSSMTELLLPDGRVVVWRYAEDGMPGELASEEYYFRTMEYWKDEGDTLFFAYKDRKVCIPKHNISKYVLHFNSETYVKQERERRRDPLLVKFAYHRQCVGCGAFTRPVDNRWEDSGSGVGYVAPVVPGEPWHSHKPHGM
jgi:hypothetical protein